MNGRRSRSRWALAVGAAAAVAIAAPTSVNAAVLVGWWHFDEGVGQITADSSVVNHLDGVLGASPAVDDADPVWTPGFFGNALHFETSDYVRLPDSAELEPATVSVTAWVRRTGSPGRWRYIVSKGASSCTASSYGLYTGFLGNLAFYVLTPSGYLLAPEATGGVWDGLWHHVAGTFDGSAVRLFIDGRQVGSGTPLTAPIHYGIESRGPYIGAYKGSCNLPFDGGDIDEVQVWDGALTAAEVAADAARRPSVPTPGQEAVPPPPVAPGIQPPSGNTSESGSRVGAATSCPSVAARPRRLVAERSSALLLSTRGSGLTRPVPVSVAGAGISISVAVRGGRVTRVRVRPPRPGAIVVRPYGATKVRISPARVAAKRVTPVSVRVLDLPSAVSVRVRVAVPGMGRVVLVHPGQVTRLEVRSSKAAAVRGVVLQRCRATKVLVIAGR